MKSQSLVETESNDEDSTQQMPDEQYEQEEALLAQLGAKPKPKRIEFIPRVDHTVRPARPRPRPLG